PTIIPVILELNGPLAMGRVHGPAHIRGSTFDFDMVLDQDTVVQYRYGPGSCFIPFFIEFRGMVDNIIVIPLARWRGSHCQWNMLFINRTYLSVHIGIVIIIVQDLDLVKAL